MKIIRLTSANNLGHIYINIEQIGDFYRVPATKARYGSDEIPAYTKVGVTTHNNGGFKVKEDCDEILTLILKVIRL